MLARIGRCHDASSLLWVQLPPGVFQVRTILGVRGADLQLLSARGSTPCSERWHTIGYAGPWTRLSMPEAPASEGGVHVREEFHRETARGDADRECAHGGRGHQMPNESRRIQQLMIQIRPFLHTHPAAGRHSLADTRVASNEATHCSVVN